MRRTKTLPNLKAVAMASLAAGLLLGAASSHAARFGDENDTSWLPRAQTAQAVASGGASSAPARDAKLIRYGDQNDLTWFYSPARGTAAETPAMGSAVIPVRHGDQNDLRWVPGYGRFN